MAAQPDDPTRWDVAVVGAGPVGLLLAAELAEHDVRTLVLERADSRSPEPKANGVVGHAAVELAERGLLAGTGLRVLTPPRFQFGPLALDLGVGPRNPLHVLPIPQRRLEELLERRATVVGARIRRGHEVIDFTQTDREVELAVRSDGASTPVRARFLVGCDGAHSVVRHQAGIGFPGFTSTEIARIARVVIPPDRITRIGEGFEIAGAGHVVAMRQNRLPGGGFSIAPLRVLDRDAPADSYLISTHEPRGDAEPAEPVPVEELRASLRRVLGADLPFTDATSIRSLVGNSRQADAYRIGRVLLAGDAAHVFNAGGSALNVGLQDALDLAGRLIAVLRRGADADAAELDAYETARREAGARVLRHTRAQAALNDRANEALRDVVGELTTDRGAARRLARLIERG